MTRVLRVDEPVLVVDSVGKRFGEHQVLGSAYFQALPGRLHGLVGRNGSGKTTLLRIAAGLLRADHGILRFQGRLYLRPRLATLARAGLFFWPSEQPLLSPEIRVEQHLRGLRAAWQPPHYDEVLERLALAPLLAKPGAVLSGGEVQRCHLAMALLRQPVCLLADEPFRDLAGVDAEMVMECLRDLAREGTAVVVTGHELTFVLGLVDDVTWLTSGTTRFLGSTREAEADDCFRRDFLAGWTGAT